MAAVCRKATLTMAILGTAALTFVLVAVTAPLAVTARQELRRIPGRAGTLAD